MPTLSGSITLPTNVAKDVTLRITPLDTRDNLLYKLPKTVYLPTGEYDIDVAEGYYGFDYTTDSGSWQYLGNGYISGSQVLSVAEVLLSDKIEKNPITLSTLSDVSFSSPTNDEVLTYFNGQWINLSISDIQENGLNDHLLDLDNPHLVTSDEVVMNLTVTNPSASAVSAPEDTIAKSTDKTLWLKTGTGDSEWEQLLTSTNGKFYANIELADVSDEVLNENVIGVVDGRLAVGDGLQTGGYQIVSKFNDGDTVYIGDYTFTFTNGIGVLVSGPTNAAVPLNIPATWFPSSISNTLFQTDNLFTSLHIPNSVVAIGNSSFAACVGLTGHLVIPNSVKSIGASVFDSCGFTSVVISDSVTVLETDVFNNSSITSVTLPSNLTYIGDNAFNGTSLTSAVVIPSTVTFIGELSFAQINSSFDMYINSPSSVFSVELAFAGSSINNLYVTSEFLAGYDGDWVDAQFFEGNIVEWTSYPNPMV
jgi:hypothetical protein